MSVKISLCMAVWNTSHLLKRSIYSIVNQTMPKEDYEVIIIDDNSYDDVIGAVGWAKDEINLTVKRLEHKFGMRGNTVSFNTAFQLAESDILAETTPECILPPDALEQMYYPQLKYDKVFVALKTYNLIYQTQLLIDTVDWKSDFMQIATLPGWKDPFTQHNVPVNHFGTHQICSFKRKHFYEINENRGYPLFGDYGSDDPWFSYQRHQNGWSDITLGNGCMAVHQWHPPFQYWMAKGYGPWMNNKAHSIKNYLGDQSEFVPDGGTCWIWDKGSHEQLSQKEIEDWKGYDDIVIQAGVPEAIVRNPSPAVAR